MPDNEPWYDKTYADHLQLLSFFGRINYTFKDTYLLTFTLRGDATSRFSKDHRWGTFPALALGWKIINEPFMQPVAQGKSWQSTDTKDLGECNERIKITVRIWYHRTAGHQ